MRNIKTFEKFSELFKSTDRKKREKLYATKDLTRYSSVMIDKESYEKSQFGQEKYKVYLIKHVENYKNEIYYIGDLRKFPSTGDMPISYLKLDRIAPISILPIKMEILREVRELDGNEMRIVNGELDKNFTGINLMDDNITYREKIKKELGIDIKENPKYKPYFNATELGLL